MGRRRAKIAARLRDARGERARNMRLWIKILIGAVALVLLLVAGAAVFISQVDPNAYRGDIADAVEAATGRQLRIGGDLQLKLLPLPSVQVNDVAFSNAPWASRPDMVQAKRLRADLALMPLLNGKLVISRFVAIEPQIFLETDAEGRGNWQFEDKGAPSAESGAQSGELDIFVSQLRIEKAVFDYLDGKTGHATTLDVETLTIGTEGPGGRLELSVRATYQKLPLALDGRLGAAGAILRNQPIEVELKGMLGKTEFSVEGAVARPLEGKELQLDIGLKSNSTKQITDVAHLEVEEIGPLDLKLTITERNGQFHLDPLSVSARPLETDTRISGSIKNIALDFLSGSGDGKAQAEPVTVDLEGNFGESRFTVAGEIADPIGIKDLRFDITLESKSSRPLTEIAGIDVEEVGPLDVTVTVVDKDGRIDLDTIQLTARPRGAELSVKGSILDVLESPRPDLDLSMSAKSLRQLDATLPDVGPVRVSAKVRPSAKAVEIRNLVAKIGKSDLSGTASVTTGGKKPRVSANLRARLIDLTEFLPPADKSDTGAAKDKARDARVFPDDPLPLDVLEKANGKIKLAVDRLVTPKLTLSKVKVTASLDNGNLTVEPAAHIAGGTFGAQIHIDARKQPAKLRANIDAKKVSISALTKAIRGFETSQGLASNLQLKLRGKGDSVRALMAGLDGDIRLEIGKGRLNNDVLDRVGADLLTQLIGVAVPSDEKDDVTMLNCGVVRFAIEDGKAVADQTLVMETDKVLLKGGGLIDLKTEELDLGANLAARKGIRIGTGALSSLVRVQGTLAEPKLGTDLTGVVKTGARIGIAVMTLGLSLVAESVYGQVSEDDHPCQTALTRDIEVTPSKYTAATTSDKN